MKKGIKILLIFTAVFGLFSIASALLFPKRVYNLPQEKNIVVIDNGLELKIKTNKNLISEVLAENNIQINEEDEIIPEVNSEILPNMNIKIARSAKVKILVDGEEKEINSFSKTVEDVIYENNISLSHLDEVEPHLQTRLRDDLDITITRIKTEEVIEEEPIDFKTVEEKDKKINWGVEKITQAGVKGVKEVSYKITYENGKKISKEKLSSKITQEPQTQIVRVGTKINVGKSKKGVASWYAHTNDLTCAAREFSPGTWLKITNRENGKSIFVKVVGWGPQPGTGRLIDLDKKAFSKIAPLGKGVIAIKVEEILNKGFDPYK